MKFVLGFVSILSERILSVFDWGSFVLNKRLIVRYLSFFDCELNDVFIIF